MLRKFLSYCLKIVETNQQKKNPAILIHMVRISEHWYKLEKIIITLTTSRTFWIKHFMSRSLFCQISRERLYITPK